MHPYSSNIPSLHCFYSSFSLWPFAWTHPLPRFTTFLRYTREHTCKILIIYTIKDLEMYYWMYNVYVCKFTNWKDIFGTLLHLHSQIHTHAILFSYATSLRPHRFVLIPVPFAHGTLYHSIHVLLTSVYSTCRILASIKCWYLVTLISITFLQFIKLAAHA